MGLTVDDVFEHVHGVCFKKGPPRRVGAETEWFVREGGEVVAISRLRTALAADLPAGSRVTFEPGGQLELSTLPFATAGQVCEALERDLEAVRERLPGVELHGYGVDPAGVPPMQLTEPRYRCMGEYFGDLTMMCATASVQVSVDVGLEVERRWRLAHMLGPVLVAAFANSATHEGRLTGWRSTRQAVWARMDRSRTGAPRGGDPVTSWAEYALDARVMLVRGESWTADPGMTFREWLRSGDPTLDDFAYHLTTLFPPVRPQGWLELRMIDALPEPYWRVPVAVVSALMDAVPDAAEAAAEPVAGRWAVAALDGLTDRALGRAALACFEAALAALPDGPLKTVTAEYADRYVARGRTPADDRPGPVRREREHQAKERQAEERQAKEQMWTR
ncbi:glutamate-cysteine ligase family protein [Actinocorallia longicatena]|uniref:Glutamate--cysteine ligase EgtA n=1 Tax=Actinocorallia longicatena TaxID=111803 RepID=A0ABP6Q0D3_9ACTN